MERGWNNFMLQSTWLSSTKANNLFFMFMIFIIFLRMKLASPSDCLDIEGNKSILTKWWKPEQQEETTGKERNNKKINDVTLKLEIRIRGGVKRWQNSVHVVVEYITFKIFSANCSSNGRLIEWKIALFHKTNFLSDQPPL